MGESSALVEVTVLSEEVVKSGSGRVFTDYELRVEQVLDGMAPDQLRLRVDGGLDEEIQHWSSSSVALEVGRRYFTFVREGQGHWLPVQAYATSAGAGERVAKAKQLREAIKGKASLPKANVANFKIKERGRVGDPRVGAERQQAANANGPDFGGVTTTGFMEAGGVPGRLLLPDTGQAMLVRYDSQVLPGSLTQAQARQALENALEAWAAVSSLRFKIIENVNFGVAVDSGAPQVIGGNRILHVQMHDLYNTIASDSTLGRGGGGFTVSQGAGGEIDGVAFYPARNRWAVLNHRSSGMDDPLRFEQVLTHEIGHALGLAHSSNDTFEADNRLREAMMFARIESPVRGAELRSYDQDVIGFGYPEQGVPALPQRREMRAVTRPDDWANSPANTILMPLVDWRGQTLTYTFPQGLSGNPHGNFSFNPATGELTYDHGIFAVAPEGAGYLSRLVYEVSNGSHTLRNLTVDVKSLWIDDPVSNPASTPHSANPLAKSWLEAKFGAAAVAANPVDPRFAPDADPDGDGLTNLQEFHRNSDPNDASDGVYAGYDRNTGLLQLSGLRDADFFYLEESENLIQWESTGFFYSDISGNEVMVPALPPSAPAGFFRLRAND